MAQIGALIEQLMVVHSSKLREVNPTLPAALFSLDTCQREIRIAWNDDETRGQWPAYADCFYGAEAYEFLVRVAAGLESQVLGETDVFGQFKKAWSLQLRSELEPVFQALFEDVKEVRSRFLQDIGGQSYGALTRKQLQEMVSEGAHVLVVGAGALAASVVPLLKKYQVSIWNRNEASAQLLSDRVKMKHGFGPKVCSEPSPVFENFDAVVECVPWLEARTLVAPKGPWIHLGVTRPDLAKAGVEISRKGFVSLDDLLAESALLSALRSSRVKAALAACSERARLRELTGQSWEDLAVFVS